MPFPLRPNLLEIVAVLITVIVFKLIEDELETIGKWGRRKDD